MQVKRTIKAEIYRLINKINAVILIAKEILQFSHHKRTFRKRCELFCQRFPALLIEGLAPNSHIKHAEHPPFKSREFLDWESRQVLEQFQDELNPPPGIHDRELCHHLGQNFLQGLREFIQHTCPRRQAREGSKLIKASRIQMVVPEEICKVQCQTAVLFKGGNPRHQSRCIAIRRSYILKDILRCLPLKLDIAALRR